MTEKVLKVLCGIFVIIEFSSVCFVGTFQQTELYTIPAGSTYKKIKNKKIK